MITSFRTFVRRHLIADDPWPQYSRLDLADGLIEAPLRTAKELAEIEARLAGDREESAIGVPAQSVKDRAYLLALVREQSKRLDAVAELVEHAANNGQDTLHVAEVQAAVTEESAA
jgi:hypothetical protein